MSENLYPAHLKQKSHSRAAVSNKQKRLQCPFEPFSGQVGWAQRGQETVPDPGSSDSETPITECTVGASNNEHRSIVGVGFFHYPQLQYAVRVFERPLLSGVGTSCLEKIQQRGSAHATQRTAHARAPRSRVKLSFSSACSRACVFGAVELPLSIARHDWIWQVHQSCWNRYFYSFKIRPTD